MECGPSLLLYRAHSRFDPRKIKGMSERILVSHYENNYGGAVKRLNSIADQLATLDYDKAPGFLINGLKREELIATNSMILHEVFFANLGEPNAPGPDLAAAIAYDFGTMERWRSEFVAMGRAQRGGSGWVILTYSPRDKRLVTPGRPTTQPRSRAAIRSWCWICTSTLIKWTSAPGWLTMSPHSWTR
jgi:superoxide dismutase